MAVSGGQVVVDILARTDQFTAGLAKAETGMLALASTGRDASWAANLEKNASKVRSIGNEARLAASGIAAAEYRLAGFDTTGSKHLDNLHAHARRTHFGFLGLSSGTILGGVGLVVAAQAFHHIQEALQVTGDKAFTTGGRIRNAFGSLITGDVIGAFGALNKNKYTGPIEEIEHKIRGLNKAGLAQNQVLKLLTNASAIYVDFINTKMLTALNDLTLAAIDTGSALNFGERGTQFGGGVGGITAENFNIKGGGNLTPKHGPGSPGGESTTIHVHGVTDPKTVANHVANAQAKKRKSNPRSRRGRVYNGLH